VGEGARGGGSLTSKKRVALNFALWLADVPVL